MKKSCKRRFQLLAVYKIPNLNIYIYIGSLSGKTHKITEISTINLHLNLMKVYKNC